jgi:flagellar biosynthesis/type III secretory pathway chaperone
LPGADGASPARPGEGPTATELDALLDKTSALAQQLLASLSGIESALSAADSARLLRELETETTVIAKLEATALPGAEAGAATGRDGIEAMIRRVEPDGGPLQRRWETLRSTLQRCSALNRANGVAVAAMEHRLRLALSLLRQGSHAAIGYGPGGEVLRTDSRRHVTRA